MLVAGDVGAVRDGRFQAVIGDCHAIRELLTHSSVAPLVQAEYPDLVELVTACYERIVDDDELLVDVVRGHTDKTFAQLPLGFPDLEVVGASGRPRSEVFTPGELHIATGPNGVELRAPGRPERLKLLAPPAGGPSIATDPLSVFSFPRHFDGNGLAFLGYDHVPRLVCGRVVLSRERWRIPAERPLPADGSRGDAADFLAAQALRRALRLPTPMFAKPPSEAKPVYVDWDSPLLVRQLTRMARAGEGDIDLTEMLPGPEDLWLEIDGRRYTSEIRFAVFCPPERPAASARG
jgi:hypothetical protein